MSPRPLEGFVIGITADRRAEEQAKLLTGRGARVVHGPTMQMHALDVEHQLRIVTESLIANPPDLLLASTGIGMRTWLAAAESWDLADDLLAALSQAGIYARASKASGALATGGLQVAWTAPTQRFAELLEHVGPLVQAGTRVALQLDGDQDPGLAEHLAKAGADVVEVPVYRCTLPDDTGPPVRLLEQICARRVDAVTFTSAAAVRNLFYIARAENMVDDALRAFTDRVIAMCVGPVCREAAAAEGLTRAIEPPKPRLGSMVTALTAALSGSRRELSFGALPVTVQGSRIDVDGVPVDLTDRERDLLNALLRRAGAVASKANLLDEVWGDPDTNVHTLEVTVARLRQRLGPASAALETVVRRGYRLDVRAAG